ncbi:myelin protein zero-like protein 2 isoform 3-T4 [Liasis olivaceus]
MAAPAPRRAGPRALGFLLLALGPVAAMEIYTPGVLEVLNGTNVRLKCTFRSSFPVGQKLTVSWYFQTEMKEPPESVLYYNYQAYPSKSGRFLGRLTWDGNVHKNDASVMLHNASPKDNGTFQCHVKNPPDVDGVIGEIQLSVVLKGKRAGWAAGGWGCRARVPPPHPPLLSLDSELLRGPHPGPHHQHFLCCDGHRCGGCGDLASLAEDAARQGNGGGWGSRRGTLSLCFLQSEPKKREPAASPRWRNEEAGGQCL